MISTLHIGVFVSWDARGLFAVGISDCERDLQTLSLSALHTPAHRETGRGQTNQKCMISKQTHPLPLSRVPFEELFL